MGIPVRYKFKKRHLLYLIIILVGTYILKLNVSFSHYEMSPSIEKSPAASSNSPHRYTIPLDPQSPWPKFRANALQNGRSNVFPEPSERSPWVFKTAKGIFSSPVIDQEGTVYIGSADHFFYAITEQGNLKWKVLTEEIIDSAALLDDKGNVYVGSGDSKVYALKRDTGEVLWKFQAHTPAQVTEEFGVKTYNLNWFEGNIAMLPDGSILAPNDNYLIYHLDRDTGERKSQFVINEMGWSLPAVNSKTGKVFTGSNFMAVKNVYAFDIQTGETEWTNGGFGTNAASAMLTSDHPYGAVIIGGYDGILRAFGQKDGFQIWKFGTRDHIYSSPAQLKDGTIIQPSTDGTVYAIDPKNSKVIWAYDTKEPIRSSPAIDGNDNIYFGSGEGRLFCLNPDGTLRWAYQLIDNVRNDINGSPGLGNHGVYIAGENGGIFFVPYDYPLTEKGKADPRSIQGPDEDLPNEGVFLFYTSAFGSLELTPPKEIEANQPISFTLFVREKGNTIKTAIERSTVNVRFEGGSTGRVDTSANFQFLTLIPNETWTDRNGGLLKINIQGEYKRDLSRFGLKFFGGNQGGRFNQSFAFKVRERKEEPSPFKIPEKAGDLSSTIEISRLAPANPSILPSYNQIGYDSLHYILGAVEGNSKKAIIWGVGGKLLGKENKTVVDPTLQVRFPMMLDYDNGLVTLYNYDGILLDMNGAWDMPIEFFRIAGKADPITGEAKSYAAMNAIVACDQIEFYGKFLKLLGMSEVDTGRMFIYGGANYGLFGNGVTRGPTMSGSVTFAGKAKVAHATISGSSLKKAGHVHSLLLVSENTGRPVPAKYIDDTQVQTDQNDVVTGVSLSLENTEFKGKARAYYMVDTYPIAKGVVEIK
ncbi:PQQ-binding-like beta-propeller repeat protein [bacterium]|nr:PQQ-binding-like beta-propeller repeat protein [bacterium]